MARRAFIVGVILAIGLCLLALGDRAPASERVAATDAVPGVSRGTWLRSDLPLPVEERAPETIEYFTSGSPPVKWANSAAPIEICTNHEGRPGSVPPELFRSTVENAVQVWNNAGAAIGYRYTGDCPAGTTRAFRNGVNEVAFDTQNEVESPTAALTHGAWSTSREFIEVDVLLHSALSVADQCLFSVIVHELGHGLGFGHSSSPGHLMYPTFDGQQVSTCIVEPTAEEVQWLITLYGANRKPAVTAPSSPKLFAGVLSSLSVTANDPDGDTLTFVWTQTDGPAVAFSPGGNSISFVAPDQVGAVLGFRVDAYDRYLSRTSANMAATILERPPPGSFTGELPVSGGYGLIVWQGGLVDSLIFEASEQGCQLISLWSSVQGKLVGYTPGAPAFVNEVWRSSFPGSLPDGLPLLAVCARR